MNKKTFYSEFMIRERLFKNKYFSNVSGIIAK